MVPKGCEYQYNSYLVNSWARKVYALRLLGPFFGGVGFNTKQTQLQEGWNMEQLKAKVPTKLPQSESHTQLGVGARIRGTLGDIDPLNKIPFKRARSRVKKGPL